LAKKPTIVKEEKRLAATIHEIVKDVTIVPRGAYYMDAFLNVQPNPGFNGSVVPMHSFVVIHVSLKDLSEVPFLKWSLTCIFGWGMISILKRTLRKRTLMRPWIYLSPSPRTSQKAAGP
jgi:hypothetical protein